MFCLAHEDVWTMTGGADRCLVDRFDTIITRVDSVTYLTWRPVYDRFQVILFLALPL